MPLQRKEIRFLCQRIILRSHAVTQMTLAQRPDGRQNAGGVIQVAYSQLQTGHQHGALPVHISWKKSPQDGSDLKETCVKAARDLVGDRMHLDQGLTYEFNLFDIHVVLPFAVRRMDLGVVWLSMQDTIIFFSNTYPLALINTPAILSKMYNQIHAGISICFPSELYQLWGITALFA